MARARYVYTHVGLTSFKFFWESLNGAKGGTAPDALPTETRVPFLLNISKFESKLPQGQRRRMTATVWGSRVFTDTIEDGVNTFSVRYLQDSLHSILLFVDDDVVGAILFGKRRFLLGGCGPDDSGAARFGDLTEEKAQTTGNGVDQYDVTLLDIICVLHKGCSSETLKEHRCRGTSRDGIGNRIHALPWDGDVLCMRTRGMLHGILVGSA